MTEIENGILSAKIDERGSQLVSVSSIKTGREYIWGADPKIWGRSAPILFPPSEECIRTVIYIKESVTGCRSTDFYAMRCFP